MMTKKEQREKIVTALVWVQVKLVLLQEFQDLTGDLSALLYSIHEDQNIVNIYHHSSFCHQFLEYVIHHGLEGGRAIGKAKKT